MMIFTFLFPSPPSLFVTTMSIINLLSFFTAGYMEMNGKNKEYAKFFNTDALKKSKEEENRKLPSRNGMLMFYAPSFLVGLAAFVILPQQDLRFVMVLYVLTFHFFKRIFEVHFF